MDTHRAPGSPRPCVHFRELDQGLPNGRMSRICRIQALRSPMRLSSTPRLLNRPPCNGPVTALSSVTDKSPPEGVWGCSLCPGHFPPIRPCVLPSLATSRWYALSTRRFRQVATPGKTTGLRGPFLRLSCPYGLAADRIVADSFLDCWIDAPGSPSAAESGFSEWRPLRRVRRRFGHAQFHHTARQERTAPQCYSANAFQVLILSKQQQ